MFSSHYFSEDLLRISLGVKKHILPNSEALQPQGLVPVTKLRPNCNLLALDAVYRWREISSGFTVKRVRKLYERLRRLMDIK